MTPDQIRTETERRLQLAEQLPPGLMKDHTLDPTIEPIDDLEPLDLGSPLPPSWSEGPPISSAIPFELDITVLGETVTYSCRARYIMTLYDEDLDGQPPRRIMSRMTTRYDLLDWIDPHQCYENTFEPLRVDTPRWRKVDLFPLIPRAVEEKLDELMEAEAIALENGCRRKLTS